MVFGRITGGAIFPSTWASNDTRQSFQRQIFTRLRWCQTACSQHLSTQSAWYCYCCCHLWSACCTHTHTHTHATASASEYRFVRMTFPVIEYYIARVYNLYCLSDIAVLLPEEACDTHNVIFHVWNYKWIHKHFLCVKPNVRDYLKIVGVNQRILTWDFHREINIVFLFWGFYTACEVNLLTTFRTSGFGNVVSKFTLHTVYKPQNQKRKSKDAVMLKLNRR